jgi:hypothetical protein
VAAGGYISPHSNQQNRTGNRFPLASRQEILLSRRCSRPRRCSAPPQSPSAVQIIPLGLRPRGPGGSPVETHNCNIPSQASTPPPPMALLRMRVGVSSHMCLFQLSARQLKIHTCSNVTTYVFPTPLSFSWLGNFLVLFRFALIFLLHFAYFLILASDFCCFDELWRPYSAGVLHSVSDQIQNLQNCFTTPNKNDQ